MSSYDWRHRRGRHGVYGTEEDPINCSFYLRMGACRHGDNCPKKHPVPPFSQTVMFEHLWIPPKSVLKDKKKKMKHYENFYEDVLEECLKYGEVEELLVLENMGDHLIGNVFARFKNEEVADKAVKAVRGRFYAGRRVHVKFSPVQDFGQGRCNDFQQNNCLRGQFCNFSHFMPPLRWASKYFAKPEMNRVRRRQRRDNYSPFPIRGNSAERRRCLQDWNAERERHGLLKKFDEPEITPHTGGMKNSRLQLYTPGQEQEEGLGVIPPPQEQPLPTPM